MHFLSIIPERILRALSSTFIFSLWQGVILAALAGLIVLLTKRAASVRRYDLLVGLLLLFTLSVTGTFIYQYFNSPLVEHADADCAPVFTTVFNGQAAAPAAVVQGSAGASVLNYINTHAELIVMIWFLIVCARCVQLFTGLYGLHRLRSESISVGEDWEERLQSMVTRMGIRQHVIMAGSLIARVPMVIGHFKPIILMPAALLTAMSPQEIEAVLVHELAHIRRRDYLVNMLQHLMEIVFFFNPAVLWVSSLIKAERENCCDDITVGQTNDKTAYIRALISCQEFQSQTPQMAVGLAGKSSLLGRVSRMVSSNNHSLSAIEKSLLACCLVAAGIMFAAFSGKKENEQPPVQAIKTTVVSSIDEIDSLIRFEKNEPDVFRKYQPAEIGEGTSCYIGNVGDKPGYKTYILKRENVLYQLNYVRDTLVSLQVAGKDIPAADWAAYDVKVHKIADEFHDKMDVAVVPQKASDTQIIFDKAENTLESGIGRTARAIDEVGMALGRSIRQVKAASDSLKALEEKTDELHYGDPGYGDKAYPEKYGPGYAEYKSTQTYRSVYKTGNEQEVDGNTDHKKWITGEELIAHLVEDGIVEKSDDVRSFMLSPQQMIMNGKKMPASVHRLVLEKYVKADPGSKWTIYYNFDISTIKSITRNGINAG